MEAKRKRLPEACIWIALALGLAFLVVKGFEYREDVEEGLWPGVRLALEQPAARVFFSFYWITTFVHACHVTIGLSLITRLGWLARRGKLATSTDSMEVTSLYWHLVDAIWVMLYPLLYLVGR